MSRVLQVLGKGWSDDRTLFILVNVVANLLFIARSYVAMRSLAYTDLGLVALLQTMILLVGALHFGVVNGGYRLLCSEGDAAAIEINNAFYTFIVVLATTLVCVAAFTVALFQERGSVLVIVLGMFAGIVTIVRNWMSNYLIAKVRLRRLNWINLISALVSIVPLAWVGRNSLLVCLAAVVLQPVTFVAWLLVFDRTLRPTGFEFSRILFGKILSAGFVVFLTGIFLMANAQIERWSIISYLGVNGLGRFYLALLFLNLYALVPSSLDAIFLPRVVKAYVGHDYARVQINMRRFLHVTLGYSVFAVCAVWLLSDALIGALLPGYLEDLRYVYLVMPGAVLFGLTSPFAIVFNVLIQYRYYLYAYGLGTLCTLFLIAAYIHTTGSISLSGLSVIKSIVSVTMGIVIVVGYIRYSGKHHVFRFVSFRNGPMAPV